MTPRLASHHLETVGAAVDVPDEQGRWRWFAVALFAAGVAIGAALILSGQPLPRPAPIIVLAVFLAFAVNRFAFFPTELAVTAEAAVLVAAIVAFRNDSALVGPWCVALLAGPLDVLHWRQRSFVRMAFNAGNRMVATLAAAAMFTAVLDWSSTRAAIVGAALAASLVFALVEGAVGVVLVRLRNGESWRMAARIELPMEALCVPLALVGAGAGYLATEVGWWAAAAVLAPTLFVPELVLARSRHGTAITRVAATIAPGAVGVAVLALLVPLPTVSTALGLLVIAIAAGIELRVDLPVPPLIAALAAAAAVVSGDAILAGAVLVAVVTTVVAWLTAREANWWAPLLAGAAALAAAAVYDARPSGAVALLAALVFDLVIVAGLARVVWTAPLVCVAVALGTAWHALPPFGAVVFGVGLAAVLAGAAACGAPPWGSRLVGPWVVRHRPRALRALVVGVALISVSCAIAASAFTVDAAVFVALASGAASAVAAMAMCAVRQWRFSPRRRAREATLVLIAAGATVLLYPSLARDDLVWSVVVLGSSMAVCVSIAWPLVRLTARAAARPNGPSSGERMPDNGSQALTPLQRNAHDASG